MSVLQEQNIQKISEFSEDDLQFLLEIIDCFISLKSEKNDMVITKRIGIARGDNLNNDDYDFDETNPEIAKMFGVME